MLKTILLKFTALAALSLLAACAPPPKVVAPPAEVPGYEGLQDGEFFIQPVNARYLAGDVARHEVAYNGTEKPGTIVVDPHVRKLYFVMPDGRAMRYSIAVGRAGLGFKGSATVNRKVEWPRWTPTANMIRTMPEMYAEYAGGLPGGLSNPLGARALYLYRNGRDTYFRIHGTSENSSIGHATSAGCIRLFNRDAIDLYERAPLGTHVKVRTAAESEKLEGRYMEDENGLLIPYDEAMIAVVEQRKLDKKAADAAAATAAAANAAATAASEAAAREAALTGQPVQG
ncbi:L,D-transpeptidase [Gemmobacter serpentinus]|uniref:L,D-transpeptidase n=1 Tax=Gemmobacter serpentinus TaxID=2652247 RepID=UPI00124F5457|nr:L,D-transpeptidase [Gemmobacter serpentinus]